MTTREAGDLADVASIQNDLGFTAQVFERLEAILNDDQQTPPADELLAECLWTTALVRYARCFATGARKRLTDDDVAAVCGPGADGFHRRLRGMRDKNVAHAVNAFEQCQVGVIVQRPETGERVVIGIATLHMKHFGIGKRDVIQFRLMLTMLGVAVRRSHQALLDETDRAIKKRPIQAIYELPPLELATPTADDVNRRRER